MPEPGDKAITTMIEAAMRMRAEVASDPQVGTVPVAGVVETTLVSLPPGKWEVVAPEPEPPGQLVPVLTREVVVPRPPVAVWQGTLLGIILGVLAIGGLGWPPFFGAMMAIAVPVAVRLKGGRE